MPGGLIAWLTSLNEALVKYAPVFEEEGYDNVDLILDSDASEREDLLAALDVAGIKKPHRKKLIKGFEALLAGGGGGDDGAPSERAGAAAAAAPEDTVHQLQGAEGDGGGPVAASLVVSVAEEKKEKKNSEEGVWPLQGRHAAFLSHFKMECAMEARHCQVELEKLLRAPIFLDSDDLTDLRLLLNDHVKNSDVILVFQSRGFLTRPYCLLEMYTAVESGVPIVAVNVQGSAPYDYAKASAFLRFLDTELDAANPGASDLLAENGVDIVDAAYKLSSVVPNIISIAFNPSGSRNNIRAAMLDIVRQRGDIICDEVTRIEK